MCVIVVQQLISWFTVTWLYTNDNWCDYSPNVILCVAVSNATQTMQLCSLALKVISCAVGNRAQQLPVSRFSSWFGCSVADVKVLCTSCGFTVNEDVISISRPLFQQPQVCHTNICNCCVISMFYGLCTLNMLSLSILLQDVSEACPQASTVCSYLQWKL